MTTLPHYLTSLDYLPLKNSFFPSETPSNRLMILLHGRGGKAEDFSWIPDFFDFDDMHYLLLNAPYIYDNGFTWYHESSHHFDDIRNASVLLTKTLDMLFKEDFDASQSFLLGFSQGSLLTFEFGARYPKELAGYIAISGQLYSPALLLKEMNPKLKNTQWLCTHGTQDKVLDFKTARKQIETLQKSGFDIVFKSYEKAHSITNEEIEMIRAWIKSKF